MFFKRRKAPDANELVRDAQHRGQEIRRMTVDPGTGVVTSFELSTRNGNGNGGGGGEPPRQQHQHQQHGGGHHHKKFAGGKPATQ